ncbi:DUF4249 domain-containing protein [Parabacteroides sp. PF5-9]|uniref:DUF4249 domain-containing protein n=1 Tax=Parabacteroides sp. PF5-9 TaxID=1742404 RepID=UPI002475C969|nr:DUF4249 domain-containing protein [Parabacteroides sp. PF5-9]MDH6359011.1 hypothetical protein [Parabacteroides sp. PF5-9]
MRTVFIHLFSYSFFIFFSGCIEEYTAKEIDEIADMLVIDGVITNGESVIKISKSVGLTTPLYEAEMVDDAHVYVEIEHEGTIDGVCQGDGTYIVQTGDLLKDRKYRLCISHIGEKYQSEFLSPLYSPEIDSLFSTKKSPGDPVNIYVSTHDPEDQTKFYRWSYNEHWEVRALLFANAGYIDGEFLLFSPFRYPNTYYCWGKDDSKVLLLGSTEKISENIISQKKLTEIEPDDDKLSRLYYILVQQTLLRQEGFNYLNNLQKNVELTGTLFSPIPSEMKGNIECLTNPNMTVIGYIEVSTTTKMELYIDESKDYYEQPDPNKGPVCDITRDPFKGYPYYNYLEPTYASAKCVDCRTMYKASKEKPDFWPTPYF